MLCLHSELVCTGAAARACASVIGTSLDAHRTTVIVTERMKHQRQHGLAIHSNGDVPAMLAVGCSLSCSRKGFTTCYRALDRDAVLAGNVRVTRPDGCAATFTAVDGDHESSSCSAAVAPRDPADETRGP